MTAARTRGPVLPALPVLLAALLPLAAACGSQGSDALSADEAKEVRALLADDRARVEDGTRAAAPLLRDAFGPIAFANVAAVPCQGYDLFTDRPTAVGWTVSGRVDPSSDQRRLGPLRAALEDDGWEQVQISSGSTLSAVRDDAELSLTLQDDVRAVLFRVVGPCRELEPAAAELGLDLEGRPVLPSASP